MFAATLGSHLVGYGIIYPSQGDAIISELLIAPGSRRQGFGTDLVKGLVEAVGRNHWSQFRTYVDSVEKARIYELNGFKFYRRSNGYLGYRLIL